MKIINFALKNKTLLFVILLAVIGGIMLCVSAVNIVKSADKNGIDVTEECSTETDSSTTANITATETTAITASATTTTTTTTTKAPDPEINSSNVYVVFYPLIRHYTSLEQGSHVAIGIDYSHNYRDELMIAICEQTDWTEMSIDSVYKFKTVKSAAEVKRIYKKYLSDDIVNQAELSLFSYNNELYTIQGAKGSFDYNANSITYKGKKNGGYVVAIDQFLGNGAYLGTESFLVKYIDGCFKIVKKLGEEQLHPYEYYPPNYDSVLYPCMITE